MKFSDGKPPPFGVKQRLVRCGAYAAHRVVDVPSAREEVYEPVGHLDPRIGRVIHRGVASERQRRTFAQYHSEVTMRRRPCPRIRGSRCMRQLCDGFGLRRRCDPSKARSPRWDCPRIPLPRRGEPHLRDREHRGAGRVDPDADDLAAQAVLLPAASTASLTERSMPLR